VWGLSGSQNETLNKDGKVSYWPQTSMHHVLRRVCRHSYSRLLSPLLTRMGILDNVQTFQARIGLCDCVITLQQNPQWLLSTRQH